MESIKNLKQKVQNLEEDRLKDDVVTILKQNSPSSSTQNDDNYVLNIQRFSYQKWYVKVKVVINNDYHIDTLVLFDSGADQNCIQEGLVPSIYFEKTSERLSSASGSKLLIKYKLSKARICNQSYCFNTQFILVKNLSCSVILGTPFISMLYPLQVTERGISTNILGKDILFEFSYPIINRNINEIKENKQKHINFLIQEIDSKRIENQLGDSNIQQRIKDIENKFSKICASIPNAFWNRKHVINLPYNKDFNEKHIPTKSKAIHMTEDLEKFCKKKFKI